MAQTGTKAALAKNTEKARGELIALGVNPNNLEFIPQKCIRAIESLFNGEIFALQDKKPEVSVTDLQQKLVTGINSALELGYEKGDHEKASTREVALGFQEEADNTSFVDEPLSDSLRGISNALQAITTPKKRRKRRR